MRRALVNDIVRSFAYACRSKSDDVEWPAPIFHEILPEAQAPLTSFNAIHLIYPAAFAFAEQPNYILANRIIIRFAIWFRALSIDERNYAIQLLKDYYVSPRQVTSNDTDTAELLGDSGQRLPEATAV